MAGAKSTFTLVLGVAAGAALATLALTQKGRSLRTKISRNVGKLRETPRRSFREFKKMPKSGVYL